MRERSFFSLSMALTLISSQQQILPSMYDLPSEHPEDPGLPDEFHLWQPQLLSKTFRPKTYPPEQVFTASDLNLDYDLQRTHLYKRPDWFAVVGVPPLLDQGRLSYGIWQAGRSPIVVVEWLSPRTIEADQGRDQHGGDIPSQWEVHESLLRVPYYVLFDRLAASFRLFRLEGASYQPLSQPTLWIPTLEIGLGLWQGSFEGVERLWLRWFDETGWIPTPEEEVNEQAKQAEQQAARLSEQVAWGWRIPRA